MNEKMETLLNDYKQAKFDTRNATSKEARKEARSRERKVNSQITEECENIKDATYLKSLILRKAQFDTAFTFTREATKESELVY